MDDYPSALRTWLERPERTQIALAEAVGTTQASIARYAAGQRFPEADLARKIDEATGGEVSFTLWQRAAMARLGIGDSEPEPEAEAA